MGFTLNYKEMIAQIVERALYTYCKSALLHGITDKAAYLSKVTNFCHITCFSMQSITCEYITPTLYFS